MAVASELNNLLQIIAGTSAQIENIWEGCDGAEKYFTMLRASIERAEAIAAELVKQAGGAESKVVLHPSLARAAAGVAAATPLPARRPTVLVVDDEPMALTLLKHVLSDAGFDVVCAQSGFQCLDLFGRAEASYDVVVLDLSMPFMDGVETFDRLRAISADVPVVLTTGFIEQTKLDALVLRGLAAYLRKPFDSGEAVACVNSVLGPTEMHRGGIAAAH